MTRTDKYREIAYENGLHNDWWPLSQFLINKAIIDNKTNIYAHNLRKAQIECSILDGYTPAVNDDELLVGRFSAGFEPSEEEKKIMEQGEFVMSKSYPFNGFGSNATHHRVIDYEKLLRIGIKGFIEEIDGYLSVETDMGKQAFYQASRMCLEAVVRFAKRYKAKIDEKIQSETNEVRKKELIRMAENFEHAPYEPCTNFYEALQCMWFVQFCFKLVNDPTLTGRLDNYLYPYYKRDIDNGTITPEFAFELIEQLYYKHNEIYFSWPASIMVGGLNRDGEAVCNELTYMCIKAISTTKLVNPSVAICYTPDMPDDLLDLCVESVAKGYTKPSIFNDRVIREGLMNAGVSERDSRYYVHSTCVEITPISCVNIEVATPYINLIKAFEYILGGKKEMYGDICRVGNEVAFDLNNIKTFDEFFELSKKVAAEIIRTYLADVQGMMYIKQHYNSSPLASAFLDDCLKRGKDAGAGGAKYDFIYPCFPGFINFIDILSAVKKSVFEDKKLTLAQLGELCSSNFENNEDIRQYLLNICPKFGNDMPEVDSIGVEMYEFIKKELKKYKTSLGATFHPSYFAWIMHGELGRVTGATPDGRKQGEALSEHLGSVQGMDKNGPLAVLYSIEKLDHRAGIGGIATNYRFSKNFMKDAEGRNAVKNLIHEFMAKDCFEIQFNVVDQKDLLDAKEHPEQYKTLLVRVAGYSDYFVNLNPVIQDEIIRRSEHSEI